MKRILALALAAVLLFAMLPAAAEDAGDTEKYELLTVGTTTPFNGNFFSEALGNNISDQDVRKLIHGYNLVYWDGAVGAFQFNLQTVTAATVSGEGLSYTFALAQGLTYNDGTPITARDYAFSLLLQGSGVLEQATGSRSDISRILGGKAYQEGTANELAGFRILGDYQFSLSIDPAFTPYFYQLKALDITPLPVSIIAPGCEVKDDGNGAYISGPFTPDLLKSTLTNSQTGYISHPSVTSGPYMLTGYDGNQVTLEINPAYIGDQDGMKPEIPRIIYAAVDPDEAINQLADGELGLVVRCARVDQVDSGRALIAGGDVSMKAYSRSGLSFISFCAEQGPTADENVRRAIISCMDKTTLTEEYLGAFGTPVDGFYGIGQWMFQMANRTLVPEEGKEEEWADLVLDKIPKYAVDTKAAGNYLEMAGWGLNEEGKRYDAEAGGLRYRQENGGLVPLKLKLLYPEENGTAPLLETTFIPYLAEAGIELEIQAEPMTELLKKYYHQEERDCDMILMGTNLGEVFDPSGEFDEYGTSRLTGITDKELAELAIHMRETEPGLATEFCRRWLAYQALYMEIVESIPLYSDAYLDFHVNTLRNYEPASTGSWASAITRALLSDAEPEEEEEAEDELEDGYEVLE